MEFTNIKEKEFFEALVAENIFDDPKIKKRIDFTFVVNTVERQRTTLFSEFKDEMEDNILNYKTSTDKIFYLKTLLRRLDYLKDTLEHKKSYFEPIEVKTESWSYFFPGNSKDFKISPKEFANFYKSALRYLPAVEKVIQSHIHHISNAPSLKEPRTNSISQPDNLKLKWEVDKQQCYDLFKELYKQKWISNSKSELVDFILMFIEFKKGKHPTKSTVEAELKRDVRPVKIKRVIVPTITSRIK